MIDTTTSWGNRSCSAARVARRALRVGDQDVGAGEERGEVVVELLLDDGAVAEVEELEERAVTVVALHPIPVALVGPAAQRIALGGLDLDHVGTGVAEQLGAVPAGDPRRAVDHLQIREQIHRLNLPGSPRRGLGRPR